jgi:hypothetical protein
MDPYQGEPIDMEIENDRPAARRAGGGEPTDHSAGGTEEIAESERKAAAARPVGWLVYVVALAALALAVIGGVVYLVR